MAELERGDGAWENTQEVLRREFMKLWGAVADKKSRAAKNEQRLRDLESRYANKVDCESFRKQQAHVEAIARAVNALSEEMRSRDAQMLEFEENPSAQLQASHDTLQDDFHNQLTEIESNFTARASEVQELCSTMLVKVERRLELLEPKRQIDEKLQSAAAANDTTETKAWLREVQQELVQMQWMQQVQESSLRGEQEQAHQRMREDLEHQLLVWKESVSKDWTLLQNQVNEGKTKVEAMDRLQQDHMALKAVSEALQADFANALIALRDLEQRLHTHSQVKMQELQAQLSDEIAKALQLLEATRRAKDKRFRLQLDAYNEKLAEVDQIVKLVGKQLIQNTSQLQLVRKEQHARRQIRMAEELALFTQEHLLLSASEEQDDELDEDGKQDDEQVEPAQPSRNNNSSAPTEDAGDHQTDETMLQQLRSQHETVRHAIQDKLRHYQEVLQQE